MGMMNWEETLEFLSREGWSYAYVKCVDLEKGTDTYYVSLRRGEEKLTSLRPTLEEAVHTLSRLATSPSAR
jgi:hypothetical protein